MGTLWNRSGTIERYGDDLPARGAKAYFYQGGTTTPLRVFQDGNEASAHPIPLLSDADGRWPAVFVPYLPNPTFPAVTSYNVRVTTAQDVQLTFTALIPNPNPVDISTTLPPNSTLATGMVVADFITNGTRAGFVRCNGKTIGNAASTPGERNNADCHDLFVYLWNNVSSVSGNQICTVIGGLGATAEIDFTAGKSLTLPDCRGSLLCGIDEMGSSSSGHFIQIGFETGGAGVAGSVTGTNLKQLQENEMPTHSHSGSGSPAGNHIHHGSVSGTTEFENSNHFHNFGPYTFTSGSNNEGLDHTHTYNDRVFSASGTGTATGPFPSGGSDVNILRVTDGASTSLTHTHNVSVSGQTGYVSNDHAHLFGASFMTDAPGDHTHTFTTDDKGGSQGFNNMPRTTLVTWFIKL